MFILCDFAFAYKCVKIHSLSSVSQLRSTLQARPFHLFIEVATWLDLCSIQQHIVQSIPWKIQSRQLRQRASNKNWSAIGCGLFNEVMIINPSWKKLARANLKRLQFVFSTFKLARFPSRGLNNAINYTGAATSSIINFTWLSVTSSVARDINLSNRTKWLDKRILRECTVANDSQKYPRNV